MEKSRRSSALTLPEIASRISKRTGIKRNIVVWVLNAFLDECREEILGEGEILLRKFIRIHTYRSKPQADINRREDQIRLSTKPVRSFRRRLNEVTMEKYGVVIDESHEKLGSQKDGKNPPCPSCGSNLVDYSGSVPVCPRCGTQPWEKERKDG